MIWVVGFVVGLIAVYLVSFLVASAVYKAKQLSNDRKEKLNG